MLMSRIRKKMSLIIWGFAIVFGISVFYVFGADRVGNMARSRRAPDGASSVPDVMVRVDGVEIGRELFHETLVRLMERYEALGTRLPNNYIMRTFLQNQALERLINQQVLIEEAEKRKLSVTSGEVRKSIRGYRDMLTGGALKLEDPGIPARIRFFFEEKKKEDFFKEILFRRGVSTKTFKEAMRRETFEMKAQEAIGKELAAANENEARRRAQDVLEKLKAGEDFAVLAAQYSDDDATKLQGGDRGWIKRNMVETEFERAAFGMAPGQVSDVVKTESGFHVIFVEDKKIAAGPEFEAKKGDLVRTLALEKGGEDKQVTADEIRLAYEEVKARHILFRTGDVQALLGEWLAKNRAGHKVEVVNPELAAYRYLTMIDAPEGETQFDYKKALALYDEAIKKDPSNAYLFYQKGAIYEHYTDGEESKNEDDPFAKAIGEATGAPETGADDGARRKNLEKALKEYREAFELAKDENGMVYDPMLYLAVAGVYEKLGRFEKARKYYAEAVDFSAGEPGYLRRIETALEKLGGQKKALKEARELIEELEEAEEAPADYPGEETHEETGE
ncbi:MAG: peptidylprolyl isomerase [bacterium]